MPAFRWFLAALAAALPLALVYWLTTVLAGALGATVAGAGWWGAAAVAGAAYPVLRASWRLATILVYRGRGRCQPRPRHGWPSASTTCPNPLRCRRPSLRRWPTP